MNAIERINDYRTWSFLICFLGLLSWESLVPFFLLFRNGKERTRHALKNLALGAVNAVAIRFVFMMAWLWAALQASSKDFGILNWLGLDPIPHAIGAVLLLDIFTYWFHRASHELPFFWRFHRVHHSDLKMDVSTANRFHLGEIVLSSILRIPAILIFGVTIWELLLYELTMFPIVQFHHANVGLSERLDRLLRIFIVTPAMHKVHHSRISSETNSNYTSLLSVWDRIFRTFRLRNDPREIEYGLHEFDADEHQTFKGLLKTPLVENPSSARE